MTNRDISKPTYRVLTCKTQKELGSRRDNYADYKSAIRYAYRVNKKAKTNVCYVKTIEPLKEKIERARDRVERLQDYSKHTHKNIIADDLITLSTYSNQ